MADELAAAALAAMDKVLRGRPKRSGEDFSQLTRRLAAWRDALIRTRGHADDSESARLRLECVNGVISVVMAGHFPLGPIPWDDIERARDALREAAD